MLPIAGCTSGFLLTERSFMALFILHCGILSSSLWIRGLNPQKLLLLCQHMFEARKDETTGSWLYLPDSLSKCIFSSSVSLKVAAVKHPYLHLLASVNGSSLRVWGFQWCFLFINGLLTHLVQSSASLETFLLPPRPTLVPMIRNVKLGGIVTVLIKQCLHAWCAGGRKSVATEMACAALGTAATMVCQSFLGFPP